MGKYFCIRGSPIFFVEEGKKAPRSHRSPGILSKRGSWKSTSLTTAASWTSFYNQVPTTLNCYTIGFGFLSLLSTPEASQDLTVSSFWCIFLLFSSDTASSRIRYWLKPEYCYPYYHQALFGIMSFQYRYELASSREEWLTAPVLEIVSYTCHQQVLFFLCFEIDRKEKVSWDCLARNSGGKHKPVTTDTINQRRQCLIRCSCIIAVKLASISTDLFIQSFFLNHVYTNIKKLNKLNVLNSN